MLNTELSSQPAILLLGIYPKAMKACPHKNLHMNVQSGITHHSQKKMETTQMFIN